MDSRLDFALASLSESKATVNQDQIKTFVWEIIKKLESKLKKVTEQREKLCKMNERNTSMFILKLPKDIANCPIDKYDREVALTLDSLGLVQLSIDSESQLYRPSIVGHVSLSNMDGVGAQFTADSTVISQSQQQDNAIDQLAAPFSNLSLKKPVRELKKGDIPLLISNKGTPLVVRHPEYKPIWDEMVDKVAK